MITETEMPKKENENSPKFCLTTGKRIDLVHFRNKIDDKYYEPTVE